DPGYRDPAAPDRRIERHGAVGPGATAAGRARGGWRVVRHDGAAGDGLPWDRRALALADAAGAAGGVRGRSGTAPRAASRPAALRRRLERGLPGRERWRRRRPAAAGRGARATGPVPVP